MCTGLTLLVWALVHFAENNHQYKSDCSGRLGVNGFAGNADFYGLGIRLGVYLQWIAQFLANCFLSAEWKSILGASIVFALALTVAVLLLTFEHKCTFTAEIIVILFIFWGGFIVSYYGSPIMDHTAQRIHLPKLHKAIPSRRFVGTSLAAVPPLLVMQIFSLWFWIRLVTAGETDYSPTPGGTFYFLFDRVSARSKPPARFMVFLCAFFALLTFGGFIRAGMGYFYWGLKSCCRTPSRTNGDHADDSSPHLEHSTPASTYRASALLLKEISKYVAKSRGVYVSNTDDRRFRIYLSTFSILYSIISIELTLVWNNISGVYDVNSTGQVIPIVAGSGTLTGVLWKMRKISVRICFSYGLGLSILILVQSDGKDPNGHQHNDPTTIELGYMTPDNHGMAFQDPNSSKWV